MSGRLVRCYGSDGSGIEPSSTEPESSSVNRIEICGGIATGKTSLARSLAHHGPYQLVEERFREIPFWEKFYTAPNDAVRAEYMHSRRTSASCYFTLNPFARQSARNRVT